MKKLYFALLALLLLGCQSPKDQEKIPQSEDSSLRKVIDSPALTGTPSQRGTEDSIRKFYERMERWRVLHGGMSKWESDK